MSVLIFLIILSVLVIVHELGHFGVAKYFGIRVDEFGLGYPPKAKKLFHWKGTDFTLNWLPFGGFVKIFGENYIEGPDEIASTNSSDVSSGKHGQSLLQQSRPVQASVLVAGVVMNFLFAWLLLSAIFFSGVSAPLSAARPEGLSAVQSVSAGFKASVKITTDTALALGTLVSQAVVGHADLSELAGPVGIVGMVGDVRALGIGYLLTFTALISLNLCIVNLLPFPALDGGRLLLVGIESLTRRRVPPRIFNTLNTVGFALLILLMILITIHDVSNIL